VVNIVPIRLGGRALKPHTAIVRPQLGGRSVLTASPWEFVSLWLRKEKQEEALFYWDQAEQFSIASRGLPLQSSPLLHYYSFMNATKALLTSKSVTFKSRHGVSSHDMRGPSSVIDIKNEGVRIQNHGIVPALAEYLGETETSRNHSLEELMFNLPYIHRTYCLTYPSQTDMFVPLIDAHYVVDKANGKAFLVAYLSENFSNRRVVNRLTSSFDIHDDTGDLIQIRSKAEVAFSRPSTPTKAELGRLSSLQHLVRSELFYINGTQTLWYARSSVAGPTKLGRFSPTMTLCAMHRLSELCRYKPLELSKFLSGKKNWLLSEFIRQSPPQFVDEIASEITGHEFLVPNVRSPS